MLNVAVGISAGIGAVASTIALAIILVAKFTEGAWLTIIVIPAALVLLRVVHSYYASFDRQLLSGGERWLDLREHAPPLVIIPVGRWDRISQKAVAYAFRLSPDIVALHCTDLDGPDAEQHETRIRGQWRSDVAQPAQDAGLPAPSPSSCRSSSRGAGGRPCCTPTASAGCGRRCCATAARTSPSSGCPGSWKPARRSGSSPSRNPQRRDAAGAARRTRIASRSRNTSLMEAACTRYSPCYVRKRHRPWCRAVHNPEGRRERHHSKDQRCPSA
jgi:hypothetical protein